MNKDVKLICEAYLTVVESNYYKDEDAKEDEELRKAEEYFSIGHHNELSSWDDSEKDYTKPKKDYCWIWNGDRLCVSRGNSHSIAFGSSHNALFKGWYDVNSGILSVVGNSRQELKSEEDIPTRLYQHLIRKFKPKKIKVF